VAPREPRKISARNCLSGTIREVRLGAVNAEVTLEIAPGIPIVSIITNGAVKELGLAAGRRAYGVIKASAHRC
jgi:molybdopterin-binding protein